MKQPKWKKIELKDVMSALKQGRQVRCYTGAFILADAGCLTDTSGNPLHLGTILQGFEVLSETEFVTKEDWERALHVVGRVAGLNLTYLRMKNLTFPSGDSE